MTTSKAIPRRCLVIIQSLIAYNVFPMAYASCAASQLDRVAVVFGLQLYLDLLIKATC